MTWMYFMPPGPGSTWAMEEKQVESVQKQKLIWGESFHLSGGGGGVYFRGVHGRGALCSFSELCDSCFDFFWLILNKFSFSYLVLCSFS